jgi:hypothetical protein
MSFRSSTESRGGSPDAPDFLYYNADIINANYSDRTNGIAQEDPPIRFNETRQSPLVRDASLYHFSIIRFTMNGANLDLPLFIPQIQLGQSNPDLTAYSCAITYQQRWVLDNGAFADFAISPPQEFVDWVSETQNPTLAPAPRPPITTQDLSSRYYWLTNFQPWVVMMNFALSQSYTSLFNTFYAQWQTLIPTLSAGGLAANPFPFLTGGVPDQDLFLAYVNCPSLSFSATTNLFSIFADSTGFGQRIEPFIPTPYVGGATPVCGQVSPPVFRLFFNTNMYGLFSNFPSVYFNVDSLPNTTTNPSVPTFTPNTCPAGYVYEIGFFNDFFQNVVDYRLPPYGGTPPLGTVPVAQQKPYYQITQDYTSTDSLWSPIASLVFTTSLLPVEKEQTGQPQQLGVGNLGYSQPTTQSAFQPIITDIANDTSTRGAATYRQFIYYAPQAQYRLLDFATSQQPITSIDIQVYWKNRLDNSLNPIRMFNLSSVSIKCLFQKKTAYQQK